ncbi:MAG: hypothetical protein HY329_18995 [Chloroflexi bacterium]|nr:hypothetical protein [Chloroflexota bacterium]
MPPKGDAESTIAMPKVPAVQPLTSVETKFLLEAVKHYCATKCPNVHPGEECVMLDWTENVHTGAIQTVCGLPPDLWDDRLSDLRH